MANINLLKGTSHEEHTQNVYSGLNRFGVFVLVVAILAYGYLAYAVRGVVAETDQDNQKTQQVSDQIQKTDKYTELVNSQQKIQGVKTILDQHMQWSKFIQSMTNITLKTAFYKTFVAHDDGSAEITGTVPNFTQLDKLIKAYSLDQFNYIKNVQLTNVSLASDTDQNAGVNFNLKVNFNQDLLQWDKNKK